MRPFLRWAGSKRQLLPMLTGLWRPEFKRYVEPFMGSACLFFATRPEEAILGDLNGQLIETFTQVRDNPNLVFSIYSRWANDRNEYYRIRNIDITNLDSVTRAARFLYLNRYCFNGLYRTNKQGKFNVPYGAGKNGTLPSIDNLKATSCLLHRAALINSDFEAVVRLNVRPADFVYLDPPYLTGSRRLARQQYGPPHFCEQDIERLLSVLRLVDSRGAWFVLSYASGTSLSAEVNPWSCITLNVRRNIAGFANHRRHATEVLITNLPINEMLQ